LIVHYKIDVKSDCIDTTVFCGILSDCEDFLLSNMTTTDCIEPIFNLSSNGVCYNGTSPYFIWDEEVAKSHGIKKVLATESYLQYALTRL